MQEIHGGDIYRNHVEKDFSVNVNPLGIPNAVKKALRDAVELCSEYPDIRAGKLKKAVSGRLAVPEEYLLFGNGASELIMGTVRAVKPGKTVIPIPSFYGYEYAARAAGSVVLYHQTTAGTGFMPDRKLLKAITEDVDLLFLANPNNPTGRLTDKEILRALLETCKEKGVYVVLDECFIDFCDSRFSMLSEVDKYDNLLLVRAYTKIFSIPGVRIGYMICSNRTLLNKIERQLSEWNLSTFAQQAGIACAKQAAFVSKTIDQVKKERQFLSENLKKLGLQVFASEANFLLIYSEKPLYRKLLERGILIRDCENFRGLSKGYYRIAVKQRKDNEILLKAIGECIEQDRASVTGGDRKEKF